MIILTMLMSLIAINTHSMPKKDISFYDDGSFSVQTPERSDVKGSLFLWYDRWIYATPKDVKKMETNKWKGTISKRDESGRIEFIQTVVRKENSAKIEYEFRKVGKIDLTRGIFVLLWFPLPDFAGQNIVFTHGPPSTTDSGFHNAARGFRINVSDDSALKVELPKATVFERRDGAKDAVAINIRLTAPDVPQDQSVNAQMDLEFVQSISESPKWQASPQSKPLKLKEVILNKKVERAALPVKVALYEPLEFTLKLSATYDNPFDPNDISVDATFESPSGRVYQIPGFFYQGFHVEYENGLELLSLDGKPSWKVRFAPVESGTYRAKFSVSDRNGKVESSPIRFSCVSSDSHGFVGISQKQTDTPKYFRFDDGETLFLVGHNVTTYRNNLENVFSKMHKNGENYTRFWMYSRALGLEWGQFVGSYRLEEAWRMDKALKLAKKYEIYLMLCFDTHQDFRERWENNPYHRCCRKPMDFFTSKEAKKLYKNRLRYIIARWGYHTHMLAWEFVNEVEGWKGAQNNKDIVASWHTEMAHFIEKTDSFNHPITTSQWTTSGWAELWNAQGIDFVQSHFYANNRWADMAESVANICRQKRTDYPKKLHLFGEYGIMSGTGTRKNDPDGIHLHNGNWAALCSGCASIPVSWWHSSYIDQLDLYHVYRGIAHFVAGENLAEFNWHPVEVESISYVTPPKEVTYSALRFVGKVSGWEPMPENIRFTIKKDGTIKNLEHLPRLLHGRGHSRLRSPIVFEINCPKPTEFVLHVGKVSAGGLLEIKVDDQAVRTIELPAEKDLGDESEYQEQWDIWQTTYNRDFSFEVPAGKHEIELMNHGKDWIAVDYFKIVDYLTNENPALRVLGMQAENSLVAEDTHPPALLWIQNRAHTWFNVRDKTSIPDVQPAIVRLKGFQANTYKIQIWDTDKGKPISEDKVSTANNYLELRLPEIKTDLAVKIIAASGSTIDD